MFGSLAKSAREFWEDHAEAERRHSEDMLELSSFQSEIELAESVKSKIQGPPRPTESQTQTQLLESIKKEIKQLREELTK